MCCHLDTNIATENLSGEARLWPLFAVLKLGSLRANKLLEDGTKYCNINVENDEC